MKLDRMLSNKPHLFTLLTRMKLRYRKLGSVLRGLFVSEPPPTHRGRRHWGLNHVHVAVDITLQ